MTLDLCRMPKPAKRVGAVGPEQVPQMQGDGDANSVAITLLDDHSTAVNLFEAKRLYGFFPFVRVSEGVTEIAVRRRSLVEPYAHMHTHTLTTLTHHTHKHTATRICMYTYIHFFTG